MNADGKSRWNESSLQQLIKDGTEENLQLEYKSAAALKRENKSKEDITKDVSAMANSAGGTIIYGMAEDQDKRLPARIDPIDPTQFPKEWLEQIINQIQPRIQNVNIEPLKLGPNQDGVAYVVEIPQGTTAHQALTMKYHRRYNFQVLEMADHEIRDVMNRLKTPRLEIELLPMAKDGGTEGVQYEMSAWILNASEAVTAYDVTIWIERHPPNWNINTSVWQFVKRAGPDGKYVFQYSLHPGDREFIAKWTAGPGSAPIANYFGHGGRLEYKPDLNQVTFSQPEYKFRFRMFAKDQSAMDFFCGFSKDEMEQHILKRFQPAKVTP